MTELEEYYNKFNEEKRLNSRHGRVEFITSMKYIHDCLGSLMNEKQLDLHSQIKILDVGAGTVVAKSIPDGEVWAGNPARFIRKV